MLGHWKHLRLYLAETIIVCYIEGICHASKFEPLHDESFTVKVSYKLTLPVIQTLLLNMLSVKS